MLDNIKHIICLKSVDKDISDKNFDLALEKLNFLVNEEYKPAETILKRGKLCHKLLMFEEAYSDFTYIITHCAQKQEAYYERVQLNYETGNFYGAIIDAERILAWDADNFEIKRIKFLSLVFSSQEDFAKDYLMDIFEFHKYKAIRFLLQETAIVITQDEFAKGLKLLQIIDMIDKDNPIKLLKEAGIYELAGQKDKKDEVLKQLDNIFPRYFISHFKISDMYTDKDLMEICFLLELKIFDSQNLFPYPMLILESYRNHSEGHITDAKECLEKAIEINPLKPEGYVLLAQTLQLMSGYDNPELMQEAEENYRKAMTIYQKQGLNEKADEMKRQLNHIKSGSDIYSYK